MDITILYNIDDYTNKWNDITDCFVYKDTDTAIWLSACIFWHDFNMAHFVPVNCRLTSSTTISSAHFPRVVRVTMHHNSPHPQKNTHHSPHVIRITMLPPVDLIVQATAAMMFRRQRLKQAPEEFLSVLLSQLVFYVTVCRQACLENQNYAMLRCLHVLKNDQFTPCFKYSCQCPAKEVMSI